MRVRTRGRGVLMLVPEIALTPQVAALFRARFGAARRDPAQRPVRRRASRSVAPHPPRRRRRRGRHALGGVRAARQSRPDRRRRGARHLVQAGRDAALSRPRRRDHARQVRRRAGRARLGDAVDRVVRQRARRPLHAGHARARACSIGRWPSVRVVDMREEIAEAGAGRRAQPAAASRRCASGSSAASSR